MRISDWSSDVCSSDLDIAGKTTYLNLQIFAFEALPRFTQGRAHDCRVAHPIARSSTRNLGREHIHVDPADSISRSQNHGAFNDIAELPDIAWPFIGLQCRHGVSSYLWRRHTLVGCIAGEVMFHQRRSEEHTSELQSLMRNSYAVFCLKKKTRRTTIT